MSVTYGAAGTTSGFTTEIANAIKEGGVEPAFSPYLPYFYQGKNRQRFG